MGGGGGGGGVYYTYYAWTLKSNALWPLGLSLNLCFTFIFAMVEEFRMEKKPKRDMK